MSDLALFFAAIIVFVALLAYSLCFVIAQAAVLVLELSVALAAPLVELPPPILFAIVVAILLACYPKIRRQAVETAGKMIEFALRIVIAIATAILLLRSKTQYNDSVVVIATIALAVAIAILSMDWKTPKKIEVQTQQAVVDENRKRNMARVPCPNHCVIFEADKPDIMQDPYAWRLGILTVEVHLYFVCAHSGELVNPPLKLTVSKKWWSQTVACVDMVLTTYNIFAIFKFYCFPKRKSDETSIKSGPKRPTRIPLLSEWRLNGKDDDVKSLVLNGAPDKKNVIIIKHLGKYWDLIDKKAKENDYLYNVMSLVKRNGQPCWVQKKYEEEYQPYFQ